MAPKVEINKKNLDIYFDVLITTEIKKKSTNI